MSSASSESSIDFEIIENSDVEEQNDDVCSSYKPEVIFHEVFDVYPMDADIVARIAYDKNFVKSSEDTVIVLPMGWKCVDQALCAAGVMGSYVRFDVKELPKIGAEDKFYQLCYCTGEKIVKGVSIPFSFREVHEDELVEFQKEQNKEFWTFRSRFAVLMDIYWNSLEEKKVVQYVENSTSVNNLNESLDDNEEQTKPSTSEEFETDSDNNHRILLFKIMKTEYEDLKRKYDDEQKVSGEYKNKYQKMLSLLSELKNNFRALRFSQFLSVADRNNIMQIIQALSTDGDLLLNELTALNELADFNATFVATSNGDILFARPKEDQFKELVDMLYKNTSKEVLENKIGSDNSSVSDNVPDDWKAEKTCLLEKIAKLETELNSRNNEVQELNELLINQRQSEVEKIITVTDNMRDRYIKDMNRLRDENNALEEQLKVKNEEIENINKNILEMSKLLTSNEEEIRNLKARDHSLVGFLERRNLKRISELEDRLHDLYANMWVERKETIKLREDLLTSQALFNSLREEKEKTPENSMAESGVQTNSENDPKSAPKEEETTESKAQVDAQSDSKPTPKEEAHNATSAKPSQPFLEHTIQSFFDTLPRLPIEMNVMQTPPEAQISLVKLDAENKQKEEALAAKLVEVAAELEKMKDLYAKTKVDLETRLKDGAKQYAKLYMKYNKLVKRTGEISPKSST